MLKLFNPQDQEVSSLCHQIDELPADEQAYKDKVYERLMSRCEVDHDTECMIYTGCWTRSGVGRVRVGQRVYNIAKVAAWVFHGVPLYEDVAYHTCANPACFSPDHVGTKPTTSLAFAARYSAGRALRQTDAPAQRPGRRFDYSTAACIRKRLAAGDTVDALASEFEVSRAAITAIQRGAAWAPRDNYAPITRRAA